MDSLKTNHPLLLRQFKRNGLDLKDIAPAKRDAYANFLLSVSRAYSNYEQDLYLLERSMRISSNELMELNEKLESSQQIAHLGYWRYDRETDALLWSKEMFELTGFDPASGVPPLSEILQQMGEEQQIEFEKLMQRGLNNNEPFALELLFRNKKTNQYTWHYSKTNPDVLNLSADGSTRYLTGIVIDITERKQHEETLKKTHQQLLSLSRQAGMAEVATSILHNIGNVLNSASVAINLLEENFSKPYYEKLFKIGYMLKENHDSLNSYLTQDKIGKLIPSYLNELLGIINEYQQENKKELASLNKSLTHIKEIVAMQKTISGTSGLIENIFIPEVIETAIHIAKISEKSEKIVVIQDSEKAPFITSDRTKLLQILINLLRNAEASVLSTNDYTKEITIEIKQKANKIIIIVSDNGIGIAAENLQYIFSFGFTTKKNGHGFGLHSSALLAKECGGSLRVESQGIGYGATFTLTLPIHSVAHAEDRQ